MPTFCLSLHAGYRCRHAGACCRNWTVQAEPQVVQVVEARQIRRAGVNGAQFLRTDGRHASSWTIARDPGGNCVFFDGAGDRLCAIHRDAGVAALPSACRHFPRKILRDGRGTFISLSHYCPTAASLLLARDPLDIVDAPASVRLEEPIEGLDAREALPPLVRPGLLSDLDGYTAWEQAVVRTFARPDLDYARALDVVSAATAMVRDWQPGGPTLGSVVDRAFHDAGPSGIADPAAHARAMALAAAMCAGSVPADAVHLPGFDEGWASLVAPVFDRFDTAMKNYLAARAFANWIAYQGRGLRSIVEWLRTAAELVRHYIVRRAIETGTPPGAADFVEAVRLADLLLLHVADTRLFARRCAALEGPDPR